MKYFVVWDGKTKTFLTRGTARECAEALGIRSPKQFRNERSIQRVGGSRRYLIRDFYTKDPFVSPCWTCSNFPEPDYRKDIVSQSCNKPSCARQEAWLNRYMKALRERYGKGEFEEETEEEEYGAKRSRRRKKTDA